MDGILSPLGDEVDEWNGGSFQTPQAGAPKSLWSERRNELWKGNLDELSPDSRELFDDIEEVERGQLGGFSKKVPASRLPQVPSQERVRNYETPHSVHPSRVAKSRRDVQSRTYEGTPNQRKRNNNDVDELAQPDQVVEEEEVVEGEEGESSARQRQLRQRLSFSSGILHSGMKEREQVDLASPESCSGIIDGFRTAFASPGEVDIEESGFPRLLNFDQHRVRNASLDDVRERLRAIRESVIRSRNAMTTPSTRISETPGSQQGDSTQQHSPFVADIDSMFSTPAALSSRVNTSSFLDTNDDEGFTSPAAGGHPFELNQSSILGSIQGEQEEHGQAELEEYSQEDGAEGAERAHEDDGMDESERLAWELMREEQEMMLERLQLDQMRVLQSLQQQQQEEEEESKDDAAMALRLLQQEEEQVRSTMERLDEIEEVDPDQMSYDELLELTAQIGDVKQERWRIDGRQYVSSLRTISYSLSDEDATSSKTCLVCQYDFQSGEELKLLPCSHAFHPECIDPWLQDHDTCVTCKQSLKDLIKL